MKLSFDLDTRCLEADAFACEFHDAALAGSHMGNLTKHCPWILEIVNSIPILLAEKIKPDIACFLRFQRVRESQRAA